MDETQFHPSTHPSIHLRFCDCCFQRLQASVWNLELFFFFFPLIILSVWGFFMPLLLVHFFCCLQKPFLLVVFLLHLVVFLRAFCCVFLVSFTLSLFFFVFFFIQSASLLLLLVGSVSGAVITLAFAPASLHSFSNSEDFSLFFSFTPWKRVSRNKQVFQVRRSFR